MKNKGLSCIIDSPVHVVPPPPPRLMWYLNSACSTMFIESPIALTPNLPMVTRAGSPAAGFLTPSELLAENFILTHGTVGVPALVASRASSSAIDVRSTASQRGVYSVPFSQRLVRRVRVFDVSSRSSQPSMDWVMGTMSRATVGARISG